MPFNSDGTEVKASIYVMLIDGALLFIVLLYMIGKYIFDKILGNKSNSTNTTNDTGTTNNTPNGSNNTPNKKSD